jgi:hypothetical protein
MLFAIGNEVIQQRLVSVCLRLDVHIPIMPQSLDRRLDSPTLHADFNLDRAALVSAFLVRYQFFKAIEYLASRAEHLRLA